MLTVRKLSCSLEGLEELKDIGFEVGRGKITAVIGNNGSGKSNLLEAISGLRPFRGEVRINRFNIATEPVKAKAHLGYLANPVICEPHLTGFEFLELVGSFHHMSPAVRRQEIVNLAKLLRCEDYLFTLMEQLRPAMHQKIAFIAAVMHRPIALVLDEPLLHFDPIIQLRSIELIRLLRQAGSSILIATNHLALAEILADDLVVLHQGQMVFEGSLKQLAHHLDSKKTNLTELYFQLIND